MTPPDPTSFQSPQIRYKFILEISAKCSTKKVIPKQDDKLAYAITYPMPIVMGILELPSCHQELSMPPSILQQLILLELRESNWQDLQAHLAASSQRALLESACPLPSKHSGE